MICSLRFLLTLAGKLPSPSRLPGKKIRVCRRSTTMTGMTLSLVSESHGILSRPAKLPFALVMAFFHDRLFGQLLGLTRGNPPFQQIFFEPFFAAGVLVPVSALGPPQVSPLRPSCPTSGSMHPACCRAAFCLLSSIHTCACHIAKAGISESSANCPGVCYWK